MCSATIRLLHGANTSSRLVLVWGLALIISWLSVLAQALHQIHFKTASSRDPSSSWRSSSRYKYSSRNDTLSQTQLPMPHSACHQQQKPGSPWHVRGRCSQAGQCWAHRGEGTDSRHGGCISSCTDMRPTIPSVRVVLAGVGLQIAVALPRAGWDFTKHYTCALTFNAAW